MSTGVKLFKKNEIIERVKIISKASPSSSFWEIYIVLGRVFFTQRFFNINIVLNRAILNAPIRCATPWRYEGVLLIKAR